MSLLGSSTSCAYGCVEPLLLCMCVCMGVCRADHGRAAWFADGARAVGTPPRPLQRHPTTRRHVGYADRWIRIFKITQAPTHRHTHRHAPHIQDFKHSKGPTFATPSDGSTPRTSLFKDSKDSRHLSGHPNIPAFEHPVIRKKARAVNAIRRHGRSSLPEHKRFE